MSTPCCTPSHPHAETEGQLPQTIVAQIEQLQQERIRALAEQPFHTGTSPTSTGLEQRVDDLLDSLHTLRRLEILADYVAQGGQIAVDADRLLIAEHEEMFLRFLTNAQAESETAVVRGYPDLLLPAFPMPLD